MYQRTSPNSRLFKKNTNIIGVFTKKHDLVVFSDILKLQGIEFCRYLISRLEKYYILRVFTFPIWWLQNISRVFNFAVSVKIRNESLIEYQFSIANQCNCYQICYRNSNFVTISRDMQYTGINIIIWSNIRKKSISNSAGI